MTITPPPAYVPPAPFGYKSYITGAAGVIALVVMPYLHTKFPAIPALDETNVQMVIGAVVSLGIVFHRFGISTAAKWILSNVGPVLLPQLESVVVRTIQTELARNQSQAAASGVDVGALQAALARLSVPVASTAADALRSGHEVVKLAPATFVAVPRA